MGITAKTGLTALLPAVLLLRAAPPLALHAGTSATVDIALQDQVASATPGPAASVSAATVSSTSVVTATPLATATRTSSTSPTPLQPSAPRVGEWQDAPPLPRGRRFHNATLLADGRVIVTGGAVPGTPESSGGLRYTLEPSAWIFDPETMAWTEIAPLPHPRIGGSSQVLDDGRMVLLGGTGLSSGQTPPWGAYEQEGTGRALQVLPIDVYDPRRNEWDSFEVELSHLGTARGYLGDGRFVLLGFFDSTPRSVCTGHSGTRTYVLDVDRRTVVRGPELPSARENALVLSSSTTTLDVVSGRLYDEFDAGGPFDTCIVRPKPDGYVFDALTLDLPSMKWRPTPISLGNNTEVTSLATHALTLGDGSAAVSLGFTVVYPAQGGNGWEFKFLISPLSPETVLHQRTVGAIGDQRELLLVGSACFQTSNLVSEDFCYPPNSTRAEILDLDTNEWRLAADPSVPYYAGANVTRLRDGRLLTTGGGMDGSGAELFSLRKHEVSSSNVYLPSATRH